PIPDQSFAGPGLRSYTFPANIFADGDARDTLTYSAAVVSGPAPAWLTFSPATRTFSGNPSATDATPLQIAVTARDPSGATPTTPFVLRLGAVTDPPTVTGALAGQVLTDQQAAQPFAGVTIGTTDNPAQLLTVTVGLDDPAKGALAGGGFAGTG